MGYYNNSNRGSVQSTTSVSSAASSVRQSVILRSLPAPPKSLPPPNLAGSSRDSLPPTPEKNAAAAAADVDDDDDDDDAFSATPIVPDHKAFAALNFGQQQPGIAVIYRSDSTGSKHRHLHQQQQQQQQQQHHDQHHGDSTGSLARQRSYSDELGGRSTPLHHPQRDLPPQPATKRLPSALAARVKNSTPNGAVSASYAEGLVTPPSSAGLPMRSRSNSDRPESPSPSITSTKSTSMSMNFIAGGGHSSPGFSIGNGGYYGGNGSGNNGNNYSPLTPPSSMQSQMHLKGSSSMSSSLASFVTASTVDSQLDVPGQKQQDLAHQYEQQQQQQHQHQQQQQDDAFEHGGLRKSKSIGGSLHQIHRRPSSTSVAELAQAQLRAHRQQVINEPSPAEQHHAPSRPSSGKSFRKTFGSAFGFGRRSSNMPEFEEPQPIAAAGAMSSSSSSEGPHSMPSSSSSHQHHEQQETRTSKPGSFFSRKKSKRPQSAMPPPRREEPDASSDIVGPDLPKKSLPKPGSLLANGSMSLMTDAEHQLHQQEQEQAKQFPSHNAPLPPTPPRKHSSLNLSLLPSSSSSSSASASASASTSSAITNSASATSGRSTPTPGGNGSGSYQAVSSPPASPVHKPRSFLDSFDRSKSIPGPATGGRKNSSILEMVAQHEGGESREAKLEREVETLRRELERERAKRMSLERELAALRGEPGDRFGSARARERDGVERHSQPFSYA